MKEITYRDRHIHVNARGYPYLGLPKELVDALETPHVDVVVKEDGLLIRPRESKSTKRNKK